MKNDPAILIATWKHALSDYNADTSRVRSPHIAQTAYGYGAYFSELMTSDDLLQAIHENFGMLEGSDTDDDPQNEKLWNEQAKLITQAQEKYSL